MHAARVQHDSIGVPIEVQCDDSRVTPAAKYGPGTDANQAMNA
jgi:hypothetical protein